MASIVLLIFTPPGTAGFWLTCAAVLGMIGMQIVFWTYTQPANRFWLESVKIGTLGAGFFALSPADRSGKRK